MEPATIADDVAASLRQLPAGHSFSVRVARTVEFEADALVPRRRRARFHAENTLARRVLVLVSHGDCLVAGLEAREFVTVSAAVGDDRSARAAVAVDVCIEKVDTSGELGPRIPLARMLVAGYVRSLRAYRAVLDVPAVGVHLFARAQPEYLFAGSRANPGKRVLGDLALIKWWRRTLDCSLADSGPERPVAHCVVPGADAGEARGLLGAAAWAWGLPHPPAARAHDCVLQFPDDPAARLLAQPHSGAWTVATLLEMLALSEECGSGHRAAYFSVRLPVPPPADAPEEPSPPADALRALSPEDYDKMLAVLFDHDMDFSTAAAAAVSSARLTSFMATALGISPTEPYTPSERVLSRLRAPAWRGQRQHRLPARGAPSDGLQVLIPAGSGPVNLGNLAASGGGGGSSAQTPPATTAATSATTTTTTAAATTTTTAAKPTTTSAPTAPDPGANPVAQVPFGPEPDGKAYTCQSSFVDFSRADAMSKFSVVWCPQNAYQSQNSVVWKLTPECGTTMVYPWDFHYGRVEARIRIGAGSGVVTAFILLGTPPADEIDFEWVGKDLTHVQTMYYVQAHRVDPLPQVFGVSQQPSQDLSTTFQNYAIELLEDRVQWYLDGRLIRSLMKGSQGFPSDATRAKMGIWDGSQTGGWAGTVDWNSGPFTAEMQWFNFTPYC
ncbi:hypothetical protein H4R18_005405 [Coemansia javaensis]|uniref:histone acetyltransferase n=1 Tax=Coemansia javaensis TaxID=2761396 RepID=A0A9W8H6G6_9FUNG|nr:hypothetical protein H4R18_005405 [Coemansia javaensis]